MNDGPEAREALRDACMQASTEVAALWIVRFRGATLGSIGRGIAEAVGDSLFEGDAAYSDEGRPDPAGLTLAAFRADGAPLGRITVHPAERGLEAFVTELALDAAARIGCGVELRADDVVLERFGSESVRPRALVGASTSYREAPPDLVAPFAGLDVRVTREGERVRLIRETPVHTHALWLPLLIVLSVIFWWAALPALLFRDGRDFIFGMYRQTLRKAPLRWQAELTSHELVITPDSAVPHAIPLDRVRCVSLASPAWTRSETQRLPVLRLLVDGAFVEPEVPRELCAPLTEAVRRAIGRSAGAG